MFTTTRKIATRICGRAAGSIDWKEAMELLRSAPQTPPLLLEIEGDEKVNLAERMGETLRNLEGLRNCNR